MVVLLCVAVLSSAHEKWILKTTPGRVISCPPHDLFYDDKYRFTDPPNAWLGATVKVDWPILVNGKKLLIVGALFVAFGIGYLVRSYKPGPAQYYKMSENEIGTAYLRAYQNMKIIWSIQCRRFPGHCEPIH